jgi:prolyl-tRNA synthetase
LEESTHEVGDWEDFKKIMKGPRGFIKAFWCGSSECERKIKAETKATVRAIPLDAKEATEKCIYCGKSPSTPVFFAQAY